MLRTIVVVYGLILVATSVAALWKRSRPLLLACGATALGWLFTILLTRPQTGWRTLQVGVFVADLGVLVAFFTIALVWRRRWAMVAAAAQLADVAIHIGFAAHPVYWFQAYAGAIQICSWTAMLALVTGAFVEPRRSA
jgi:hypothetical protein